MSFFWISALLFSNFLCSYLFKSAPSLLQTPFLLFIFLNSCLPPNLFSFSLCFLPSLLSSLPSDLQLLPFFLSVWLLCLFFSSSRLPPLPMSRQPYVVLEMAGCCVVVMWPDCGLFALPLWFFLLTSLLLSPVRSWLTAGIVGQMVD